MKKDKHSRICIIGAGSGGLSAAYYLGKLGFHQITILEKLDRIGGKCLSVTYGKHSFDLGANYVTEAYTEILHMAKEIDAKLYTETKTITAVIPDHGKPQFKKPFDAIKGNTSLFVYAFAIIKYFWTRLKLRSIVDRPGFGQISKFQNLCVPFDQWLKENKLSVLRTLFEVPITIMGYGYLDEIPAPYALKYMSLKTFWDLTLVGLGLPTSWPKRFVDGFQRFWERIASNMNVHLNAAINRIERTDMVRIFIGDRVLEFDYLILACPLTIESLHPFLELSIDERELFQKVQINPFVLTTYVISGLELPERVVGMLPIPEMGRPWAITQQFKDSNFVQFYSRVDREYKITKRHVLQAIYEDVKKLGGAIRSDYYSYDNWDYFPHVPAADLKAGFYDDLEAIQGQQRTYYCGGLLAFELVEPIVQYSKHLVETHFS